MAENPVKISGSDEKIIQWLSTSQKARQFRNSTLDLHVYEQA